VLGDGGLFACASLGKAAFFTGVQVGGDFRRLGNLDFPQVSLVVKLVGIGVFWLPRRNVRSVTEGCM
jgi:hypothetical protein